MGKNNVPLATQKAKKIHYNYIFRLNKSDTENFIRRQIKI